MKNLKILSILMISGALLAGCASKVPEEVTPSEEAPTTITVDATSVSSEKETETSALESSFVSESFGNLTVESEGDIINVNGGQDGDLQLGVGIEEDAEGEVSSTADYSVATSLDAAEVEAFMADLGNWVLNADIDSIVEHASFPFHYLGQEINDAETLREVLSSEDSVIYQESFREAVASDMNDGYSATSYGIFMGDGELWVSESFDENFESQGLAVTTINGV
ncbi:MAG: hypothetical protein IJ869_00560 [Clostridiales bacterium]|nr:hypothetical protein [Clostridiales bacterium]